MPIIPFFSDESITLEEALTSVDEVIEASTEEQKEEEMTTEVTTEEDSTDEVVSTKKEEDIEEVTVVEEPTKESNINVTINGEPAILPSTEKTEEESRILEEAEYESELETEIESTEAEMNILSTMLECSKYCVNNGIYRLEETASFILGYESLHVATEGFKELAQKAWKFIVDKAKAIYKFIKKLYEDFITKPLKKYISETKIGQGLKDKIDAFKRMLNENKGRYFAYKDIKAAANSLKDLLPKVEAGIATIESAVSNPGSVQVNNNYLSGNVNFEEIEGKANNISNALSGRSAIEGTLTQAGFLADANKLTEVVNLVDNEILQVRPWQRLGNKLEVLTNKASSIKAVDDNENLATAIQAITRSMTCVHRAVTTVIQLVLAITKTVRAYVNVYNKVIKTKTSAKTEEGSFNITNAVPA